VQLVDSTGEEFWYSLEHHVLSPGFPHTRWTKRQIIDLYNSQDAMDHPYPVGSLSNKKLSEIVGEITDLIRGRQPRRLKPALDTTKNDASHRQLV
jgi:hypothetical protein